MVTNSPRQPDGLPAVHEAWLPREHSLHRPRHGKRQLTALICALVFFAAPTVLWMFGVRSGEIENHELASFPGIGDGWGMFTALPEWATDHLVFRGAAIQAANDISRTVFGERAPLDRNDRGAGGPIPDSPGSGDQDDGGQRERPGSPDVTKAGYRKVLEGKRGWLYFGRDIDSKCSPDQPLDRTIEQLNRLRSAVTASGRRFALVIAPDKTTMVPQNLPDDYPGKQCAREATERLWPAAVRRAGAIDLRPRLRETAKERGEPLYFRQDTHWTDEASLQLTRAVAEQLEPGVTETWRTPPDGTWSATADLTVMLGEPDDKESTRYALKPDGASDHTVAGRRKLNEPVDHTSRPTTGTVDTPTTVLGDSFTGIASRYLPAAFSDLRIMHYNTILDDAPTVINSMVGAETVVVQIVERSLAAGTPPLLDKDFVNAARTALARHPR